MSDPSPFGSPTPDPTDNPAAPGVGLPSIVDTILDLDEFLSGDVRRAEKSIRFATRPHLEADIQEKEAVLASLVGADGKPNQPIDAAVSGGGGEVQELVAAINDLQKEYADSFRSIRVRALDADEWEAFEHKHKDTLAKGAPYPKSMWDELIVKCAVTPALTAQQLVTFRKRIGNAVMTEISHGCWEVNTKSGVQIPKSLLSSRVQKHLTPGTS